MKKKGSFLRVPFFLLLDAKVPVFHLFLHLFYVFRCELRIQFIWIKVIVAIKVEKVFRRLVILIAHTEGGSPCLDSLKLVLKRVPMSVALNDQRDVKPGHFV